MKLPQRIQLKIESRAWLAEMATAHHYMHRPVHPRASPFGWAVLFDGAQYQPDGNPSGFIIFATAHFTRLRGEFGYPGLPTKWQVLCLSRLWLHDNLPHNSETCVIAKALRQVQHRWLEVHPPRFLDQPYQIVKIITYADTRFHQGTIYKAANFRQAGHTQTQPRHKNTRDPGQHAELIRFIYDLKPPGART
ncbi:MAG: hypothetical protein FJ014_13255 [Chloroflexi bacterium]|nr:hypothetical protein [Chloroflexota bacterium]